MGNGNPEIIIDFGFSGEWERRSFLARQSIKLSVIKL